MTKTVAPKDSETRKEKQKEQQKSEVKEFFTVTRETIIGDVLEKNPSRSTRLAEVMTSYGLHCIGCSANTFDTIEAGCRLHGMAEEKVDELVDKLNAAIREDVSSRTGVGITEGAANKIKELQEKDNKTDCFLRVNVQEGGCAGYSYDLAFDNNEKPDDVVVEDKGITLRMSPESRKFMEGSIIDFVDSLQGSGFKVDNPNVTRSCRCGESFS